MSVFQSVPGVPRKKMERLREAVSSGQLAVFYLPVARSLQKSLSQCLRLRTTMPGDLVSGTTMLFDFASPAPKTTMHHGLQGTTPAKAGILFGV